MIFLVLFLSATTKAQITASPAAGCAPLSVVFSGPNNATNVSWTLGGGNGTSTLSSPNGLYVSPGNYLITFNGNVNGSPVTYTYNLQVGTAPTGNFAFALPSSHCAPMTVSFTASGGANGSAYSFAFGDLTPVVTTTASSLMHTYAGAGIFVPVMKIVDAVTGCTAVAANSSGSVIVSNPPQIVMASSNGWTGCTPPFTTNINGSGSTSGSPTGSLLTFNWQMPGGNPASSGAAVPGLVTWSQGLYTVSVVVTDNNNCSASASTAVSVTSPSLTAHIPSVVCIGEEIPVTWSGSELTTSWSHVSTSSPTVLNNYNPGGTNNDTIPPITVPGLQTVTVVLNTAPGCAPIIQTYTTFVEQITASFVIPAVTPQCSSLAVVTVTNLTTVNSGAALSFYWTSGAAPLPPANHIQGSPQTTNNTLTPVTFTYYQGSNQNYVTYDYFTPTILLVVTSTNGCTDASVAAPVINMRRPTAKFNMTPKMGCSPLVVNFRDTSTYHSALPITSYTWSNGANPPTFVTGNGNNIPPQTFTYSSPGVYYPQLKIQTTGGCIDTSYVDTVFVAGPPAISASIIPQPSVCVGQGVQVIMSGTPSVSTPSNAIQHWHVTSSNGMFSGCVSNSSPTYSFTQTGVQNFTVSAYHFGCATSSVLSQNIVIKGPLGRFRHETNCTGNKKAVNFYVHLEETQTAVLNYGDGNFTNISGNASGMFNATYTHTYNSTGNFSVTLVATNNATGCGPNTYTETIKVREPRAKINFKGQPLANNVAIACTKSRYFFTANTSNDAFVSCNIGYRWFLKSPSHTMTPVDSHLPFLHDSIMSILDTLVFDPLFLDTFRVAGNYTLTLRIKDENNCTDTATRVFRISSAKPQFTLAPNPVCSSNLTMQIQNGTYSAMVSPDAITNYTWSVFSPNFQAPVFNTLVAGNPTYNPTFSFGIVLPQSQTFSVMAIAKNNLGCIDTTIKTLQINNPFPNLVTNSLITCIPKNSSATITFSAVTGATNYVMDYDDPPGFTIQSSNFLNKSHTYVTPGTYKPKLTITDLAGCSSTQELTIRAIGQPTAKIVFKDNLNSFCAPGSPTIFSTPSVNVTQPNWHLWTVGSVTTPPPGNDTLTNIFPKTGSYPITLKVSVDGFCESTATATVTVVEPPSAKAIANKNKLCVGDTLKVSIKDSLYVMGWKWFFMDNSQQPLIVAGTPLANMYPQFPYTYTSVPASAVNGSVTMYLLYYSSGMACNDVSQIKIQLIDINPSFIRENDIYAHCLGVTDKFQSTTQNPLGLQLNYSWNFNTATGTGSNPAYTFTQAGQQNVSMTVLDTENGCKRTTAKTITVFPLPLAGLVVADTACPNAPFLVVGSGTPGLSGSVSGTLQPNGKVLNVPFKIKDSALVSTRYSLVVSDNNGCLSNGSSDSIYVQQPAKSVKWDTTIIIGKPVNINAWAGSNFTYTWSPETLGLNCLNCPNPVTSVTADISYTVLIEDQPLNCFVTENSYAIKVLPLTSLELPGAFTPNGDGINDIIVPDGWGIKKLIYFRIYNRWGHLLYETDDITKGWDGKFQGIPQNMDTYVYQASVETYTNETIEKSGTFKLIR